MIPILHQRITGKNVVITGATAGIGRATALKFAQEGATVALLAREPDALKRLKDEIESFGGKSLAISLDVADADAVNAAALEIERTLGPIDVWINNAMVTVFSPVTMLSPEEFHRVTAVTYHGTVHGTMAALRHMRPRNRGTIVQIGSALAYRGIPLQSAYCGAKHAIRGFTDSLRTELLHESSRIRITMLHMPAVNTPQFDWARTHMPRQPRPVAPVFKPEAVAHKVYLAACVPVREYWIGGSTVLTVLGNILAPGLLDRFLARSVWQGQMRSSKVTPDRQDNLHAPLDHLHQVNGPFERESRPRLRAFPASLIRFGTIATLGVVALVFACFSLPRTKTKSPSRTQNRRLHRPFTFVK